VCGVSFAHGSQPQAFHIISLHQALLVITLNQQGLALTRAYTSNRDPALNVVFEQLLRTVGE
jgi:hypothetical protein